MTQPTQTNVAQAKAQAARQWEEARDRFERDVDEALALERQIEQYIERRRRAGLKCVVFPRANYIRPTYFESK